MTQEVEFLINKTLEYGQTSGLKSFINRMNELIINPDINAYFSLTNVETVLDFKCKVLNWLSYFCAPNHWYKYWSPKIRKYINYILETDFSNEDLAVIYDRLGNAINTKLTIEFINSGYNMNLLKEKREQCIK